jgi:hypothetical protein
MTTIALAALISLFLVALTIPLVGMRVAARYLE